MASKTQETGKCIFKQSDEQMERSMSTKVNYGTAYSHPVISSPRGVLVAVFTLKYKHLCYYWNIGSTNRLQLKRDKTSLIITLVLFRCIYLIRYL